MDAMFKLEEERRWGQMGRRTQSLYSGNALQLLLRATERKREDTLTARALKGIRKEMATFSKNPLKQASYSRG